MAEMTLVEAVRAALSRAMDEGKRPNVLTAQNVGELKAKLILQGANIPATLEAEAAMYQRGVLSVPDFIANAGGVICASVEYHGGSQGQAFAIIREKIMANTEATLAQAETNGVTPRASAQALARKRIERAMSFRSRP